MNRTLVTGAAGFTGRYLVSLLATQGHEVHGVVHHTPDEPVANASAIYVADLADYRAIARIVDEVRPTHVVHLAAIAFVGHENIEELYRANVVGTRHLLEAISGLSILPTSIILASSANIYGNRREGVLDESVPPAPANDYGVSKLAAELVGQLYATRLPLIVVRPFNYTGRGQADNYLIPKIVDHARRRAPIIELGNLNVKRDFSDVRMVVSVYARLLAEPQAVGQTLNVCSGAAISLNDILEHVGELSGHRFDIRINPTLVRLNEVRTLSGDFARLESVIGKVGVIPIKDTLRWMLDA